MGYYGGYLEFRLWLICIPLKVSFFALRWEESRVAGPGNLGFSSPE